MDIVESLYKDAADLDRLLMSQNEISLRIYADSTLKKSILLASASYFERQICDLIIEYVTQTSVSERIVSFISNKAISRQYHTFFDWDANNCNKFISLFGSVFKNDFSAKIRSNSDLEESVRLFLEIGRERNRMVHQDFGQYELEKTAEEIHCSHGKAKLFVTELRDSLFTER